MEANTSPTIDKPDRPRAAARPQDPYTVQRLMKNRTATMVCVPKPFSRALRWRAGDEVLITLKGNKLVIVNVATQIADTSAAAVEDV